MKRLSIFLFTSILLAGDPVTLSLKPVNHFENPTPPFMRYAGMRFQPAEPEDLPAEARYLSDPEITALSFQVVGAPLAFIKGRNQAGKIELWYFDPFLSEDQNPWQKIEARHEQGANQRGRLTINPPKNSLVRSFDPFTLQIIIVDQGPGFIVYAVEQTLRGIIQIHDHYYLTELYHLVEPEFWRVKGAVPNFIIDFDENGNLEPDEIVQNGKPFKLHDQAYVMGEVDKSGEKVPLLPFEGDVALAEGFLFPEITATGLDGKRKSSKDARGKWLIINAWSIHCAPCIQEMPGLNQLVKDFADNDQVAFLALTPDRKEALDTFFKKQDFTYPQGIIEDFKHPLFREGIPRHVILDPEGRVRFDMVGGHPEVHNQLKRVLNQAMQKNK